MPGLVPCIHVFACCEEAPRMAAVRGGRASLNLVKRTPVAISLKADWLRCL
jgi:hypothetical protein